MRRFIAIAILGIALGLTIGFGTAPANRKGFYYDVNPVTRPVNGTTFTPSTTNNVEARYVIQLQTTSTIGGPSSARVLFQFSEDGGSTWNDGEEAYISNTITLAVILQEVNTIRQTVSAFIPRGALCKLTTTTTGTGSATYQRGAENPY